MRSSRDQLLNDLIHRADLALAGGFSGGRAVLRDVSS